MAVLEMLDGESPTDAADDSGAADVARDAAPSPFMMDYDTEAWALDSQTTDQLVGLLIAATNLL